MWQMKPEGFKPVVGEKAVHNDLGIGTVVDISDKDYVVLEINGELYTALRMKLSRPKKG